jgi:hypothetical protein
MLCQPHTSSPVTREELFGLLHTARNATLSWGLALVMGTIPARSVSSVASLLVDGGVGHKKDEYNVN